MFALELKNMFFSVAFCASVLLPFLVLAIDLPDFWFIDLACRDATLTRSKYLLAFGLAMRLVLSYMRLDVREFWSIETFRPLPVYDRAYLNLRQGYWLL